MAQQHPLERSPWVHIDRSSQKTIHRCIMTRQTKNSRSVHCEKHTRKPTILDLGAIFHIFHIFTLTNLSLGFHQINFILSRAIKGQHPGRLYILQALIVTLDQPPSKFCIRVHSKWNSHMILSLCFLRINCDKLSVVIKPVLQFNLTTKSI